MEFLVVFWSNAFANKIILNEMEECILIFVVALFFVIANYCGAAWRKGTKNFSVASPGNSYCDEVTAVFSGIRTSQYCCRDGNVVKRSNSAL